MSSRTVGRPSARALRALGQTDPRLASALRELRPFPGFPEPATARRSQLEVLARSVVHQQLSTKAAATIWGRCRALGQGRLPAPAALLALDDATLRGAGLSRQKVAALRSLAEHAVAGRLPLRNAAGLADDEIIARLTEVRGIGPWSAQMFLIFKLGRLDVWPTADLGVAEGVRRLLELDERPTAAELEVLGEPWRPLRSVVAWLAWRRTELD